MNDTEVSRSIRALAPFFDGRIFVVPRGQRIETEHAASAALTEEFGIDVPVSFYGGEALVYFPDPGSKLGIRQVTITTKQMKEGEGQ